MIFYVAHAYGGDKENIEKARNEEPFFSVEDLQIRAKLSKSVIDMLRANGVLDNVNETDQLTMRF